MKTLTFNYENVNFSVAEYPFPDTVNFRLHLPFPDKNFAHSFDYQIKSNNHYFKNIVVGKTKVALDLIRGEYAEFFDTQVSLAKLFFDGKNTIGYKRRQDFNFDKSWNLNLFKMAVREQSGILEFNPFENPLSRFDVGLNLQCVNFSDAEILRDYFYRRKIPYLPKKKHEQNTAYWNNQSAYKKVSPNKYKQPSRVFACYVTDKNRVRLESRLNNRPGVTNLKSKVKFKNFNLENNLKSLLDFDFINHFFWRDAIHLFDIKKDRKKIIEAYKLSLLSGLRIAVSEKGEQKHEKRYI